MQKRLFQQIVTMTVASALIGTLFGSIGWVVAEIERMQITIPTFGDAFLFFGLHYLASYIICLVLLFAIKSDKLFITRNILVCVLTVFVVDLFISEVEINWIVSVVYGLVIGLASIKLWVNNQARFILGISEKMIQFVNQR